MASFMVNHTLWITSSILSYEGYFNGIQSTKTLQPANSLDALSREMLNGANKNDFNQACANEVRSQAALRPAARLGRPPPDDIKVFFTGFYASPNAGTYNAVKEIYALYTDARLTTGEAIFEKIRLGYGTALTALNENLARKVIIDAERQRAYVALSADVQQKLVKLVRLLRRGVAPGRLAPVCGVS
ncbi:MAG: hypothetical protein LBB48_06475 [Treponema sp.]|jgi:hypothetical protein|nr:hypothetical protein [Treponema sp.]